MANKKEVLKSLLNKCLDITVAERSMREFYTNVTSCMQFVHTNFKTHEELNTALVEFDRLLTETWNPNLFQLYVPLLNALGSIIEVGAESILLSDNLMEKFSALLIFLIQLHLNGEEIAEDMLESFSPVLACLCTNKKQREVLRRNELICPIFVKLRWQFAFLFQVSAMLDDEEILVFHPSSSSAYSINISGVSEMDQLHVLLVDLFYRNGEIVKENYSEEVIDCLKGKGPQELDDDWIAKFRMYDYTILSGKPVDVKKVESTVESVIFGEGVPFDIMTFPGFKKRVIILDEPMYHKSSNVVRTFKTIVPNVVLNRKLSNDEYNNYMAQMCAVSSEEAKAAIRANEERTSVKSTNSD